MMEHIPCQNQDDCRLRDTAGGCFEDVHHKFYPRAFYNTALEKRFRNLDENKVRVCRAEHDTIHWENPAPEKPSLRDMREAVNGAAVVHLLEAYDAGGPDAA